MLKLLLLCLVASVLCQNENMEDCAIMPEEKCKRSNLCSWRLPVCRMGVTKCEGLPAPLCNAADACKLGEGNTCKNTQCSFAYTSSECKAYNVYENQCRWVDEEKRCISTNTCTMQNSPESCRGLANQGCQWGGKGCAPHDPCGGKSPTQCMSEGGPYKCWVTPGDCYGNAVGNLDRKIAEGAHYTIDLQETTLVNNDRP